MTNMLSTKTYRLKKPNSSEKFLPLFVGPFRVQQRIGASAYRIDLPTSCKIHPVVHVSKLWVYRADSRTPAVPPAILLEDREHFEVLDILDERGGSSSKQYLVQWKGRDVLYNTWEPKGGLSMCSEILAQYEERKHASETPLLRKDCYVIRVASACSREGHSRSS